MRCGCNNGCYNKSLLNKHKLNFGTCIDIDPDLLSKLKEKVICDFSNVLRALEKGHKLDHEFILLEISLINLIDDGMLDTLDAIFYLLFYFNNEFNSKWRTF